MSSGIPLQRKLTIGASDDPLEKEADRVADQVMSMPANPSPTRAPLQIQRFSGQTSGSAGAAHPSVERVLANPGRPLEPGLRQDMESRFGYDFSHVRVHFGEAAEQSARDIDAKAYTVGHNIVLASRPPASGTREGQRLMAHELAHVVQQGFGGQQQIVQLKEKEPEPVEVAQKEAFAAVELIESNWKNVSSVGASYDLLKPWLAKGNEVVRLLRVHTGAAFEAVRSKRVGAAYQAYLLALKTDKITYDYVSWHVVAYANLLSLESAVNRLIDSFDHDARKFTGRANAEKIVRQLKNAISGLKANSARDLGLVRTDIPLVVDRGSTLEFTITVTSSAVEGAGKVFERRTAEVRELQSGIQQSVDVVTLFLDNARQEGFEQAVEAVEDFYRIREILKGGKESEKKNPGKPKEEQKPDIPIVPRIPLPIDDEKRRKRKECRTDPCQDPLPIKWPRILPEPSKTRRPLIRTPSGDDNLEPDHRSKPQRDLNKEIREHRDKGLPPPRPCFDDDVEPNKSYDAHHRHPLFLGGAEDTVNLCALDTDYHTRGHRELYHQEDMLNDAIWIACKVCEGNLRRHPAQQSYESTGRKGKRVPGGI
jgi:hypothetical protein